MNVLFIGFQDLVHPLYDDFLEVINGQHPVRLYDPQQPLAPQFHDVQVVVDQGGWGTHAMIDAALAGGAQLWQVIGTGLDHFDVGYCLRKGIPVSHSPGIFSGIALAEHAVFLMLCLAKSLKASHKNIRSGVCYKPMTEELADKTLGLVGFGGSGRELAKRAHALGMRVLAIDVVNVPKAVQEIKDWIFSRRMLRSSCIVSIRDVHAVADDPAQDVAVHGAAVDPRLSVGSDRSDYRRDQHQGSQKKLEDHDSHLFIAEGLHRVETSGAGGRVKSRNQADDQRKSDGGRDQPPGDRPEIVGRQ